MIEDGHIHDRRTRALRELPRTIPAAVVMQLRDDDLDRLGAVSREENPAQYRRILAAIVSRMTGDASFGPGLTGNTKTSEGAEKC